MIIGKLIPAGTGLDRYTQTQVEPTEDAKANLFTGNRSLYGTSLRTTPEQMPTASSTPSRWTTTTPTSTSADLLRSD